VDSVYVKVTKSEIGDTLASSQARVLLLADGLEIGALARAESTVVATTERENLVGRVFSLRRANARDSEPLCAAIPFPRPLRIFRTGGEQTSFVADGAVGAGLRTGAGSGSVTGSLGIQHRSDKGAESPRDLFCATAGDDAKRNLGGKFLFGLRRATTWLLSLGNSLCLDRLSGETLKALVTLASSVDTLRDSTATVFTRAVLVPEFAGGHAGSGSIQYYVFEGRGHGTGTQGVRGQFHVNRSFWRLTNKAPSKTADTLARAITVISIDPRWRWAFIDRPDDPKDNTFSFFVEVGPALRWLSGSGWNDKEFRTLLLNSNRSFYYGGTLAFGIQLRQVTASVDLPYLRYLADDFQPIIGIRFDAPFFTF
jgi:hypothetical protein